MLTTSTAAGVLRPQYLNPPFLKNRYQIFIFEDSKPSQFSQKKRASKFPWLFHVIFIIFGPAARTSRASQGSAHHPTARRLQQPTEEPPGGDGHQKTQQSHRDHASFLGSSGSQHGFFTDTNTETNCTVSISILLNYSYKLI